jgi:hypothetical protein
VILKAAEIVTVVVAESASTGVILKADELVVVVVAAAQKY